MINTQSQTTNQELIKLINQPELIISNPIRIYELVEALCQKRATLELQFDGSTFCCFCQQYINENNYKLLPCGHNIHPQCFKGYLIEQPIFMQSIALYSCCKESKACEEVVITEELIEYILEEKKSKIIKNQFGIDEDNTVSLEQFQDDNLITSQLQEQALMGEQVAKQDQLIQKQKRESEATFDCGICYDTLNVNEEAITLECEHRFCKGCLQNLIQCLLQNGKYRENDIVCSQCNQSIDFAIINYCAPDCSQKIADLRVQNLQSENVNEKLVRCPSRNCPQQFFIHKDQEFPICMTCQQEFCANGCEEVHKGITCEQYQKKIRVTQQKGLVKCPKCNVQILKDGGCNHITCVCKHEFCYVCQKNYKPKRECTCPQMTRFDRLKLRFLGFFNID